MHTRILVLGSGDVGSAVAHRLFLSGSNVVLADAAAPAHPRRSMAFTDAWFDDTATLEGVAGLLVTDAGDLAAQCTVMDAIACTPQPDTHGLGARPVAPARWVLRALSMHDGLDNALFGFEAS